MVLSTTASLQPAGQTQRHPQSARVCAESTAGATTRHIPQQRGAHQLPTVLSRAGSVPSRCNTVCKAALFADSTHTHRHSQKDMQMNVTHASPPGGKHSSVPAVRCGRRRAGQRGRRGDTPEERSGRVLDRGGSAQACRVRAGQPGLGRLPGLCSRLFRCTRR